MAKQQNVNKIDNGNGASVSLADFLADNSLFDQLSAVDQITAKLVLQSIETAKKQGVIEEQKRVEMEREARLNEIRLSALNRDFWSMKSENSIYKQWNVALNGIIQSTLPVFLLSSGIPWAFFNAPEFEPTGELALDQNDCTIPVRKDISKRLIVRQFADFWIDFRVTLHSGIKPEDKPRGRKASKK